MALTDNQRIAILLEILGGPKAVAEMRAVSAETRRLAMASRLAGREAQTMGRRSFIAQQSLFTLRRYAFYGTLALTVMAGAVAKLGYEYLSAMQQARVALTPVIKDQAKLNDYLNQLFQISKYSPFVITDLAVSFRQLFAGLHPLGMEAPAIIKLMRSLTDFMSASGKIGPGQMSRLAIAMQHMAYAGRVTGYASTQLTRLGIPVPAILKSMGVSETDSIRIAKLNIPAQAFIAAMERYARITPLYRNSARRQSLKTFHGLLQVARDTISQLSGGIMQSAYGGGQSFLGRLFRSGGPFDIASQIATKKGKGGGGGAAVKYLSAQFTGTTGLGQGILLLTNLVKNLGRVFVLVLLPAFVLALHSLILFWPILWPLNKLLKFMADNAWWLKFVFAALAAEFVITHFALLGLWSAQKLWVILTFGSTIGSVKNLIKYLKILRTVELTSMFTAWSRWAWAETEVVSSLGGTRSMVSTNTGRLARMSRVILFWVVPALQSAAVASWEFTASLLANPITWLVVAVIALTVGLVVLYYKWKRFHDFVQNSWKWFQSQSLVVRLALAVAFGPIIEAAIAMKYIIDHFKSIANFFGFGGGGHATAAARPAAVGFGRAYGTHAAGGWVGVGENGPEIAHLPLGTRITPAQSVKGFLNTAQFAGHDDRTLYSTIVMPNGKVLAEVVSKARTDKESTR